MFFHSTKTPVIHNRSLFVLSGSRFSVNGEIWRHLPVSRVTYWKLYKLWGMAVWWTSCHVWWSRQKALRISWGFIWTGKVGYEVIQDVLWSSTCILIDIRGNCCTPTIVYHVFLICDNPTLYSSIFFEHFIQL